jgi:oxygen-independent coproporphyrinogen-3 oxidase
MASDMPNEENRHIETTIEINPGCITEDKIKEYVNYGVNRVSIGIQSTHDDILKKIGRIHSYEDGINTVKLCKSCDIDNISVDLIYPLPELSYIRFKESLHDILDLVHTYDVSHISIYNLEVHENTKLDFLLSQGYLSLVDEDEELEMKKLLNSTLIDNGFKQYEISNYAKKGYESKHNLNYWNQGMYLGFGVNASSFLNGVRYTNTNSLEKYIDLIQKNESVVDESSVVELNKLDLMKEFVILKLRLIYGINIKEFKSRFKVGIYDIFKKEIDKLINLELLTKSEDNIYLTQRGKDVANIVWQEFI